MRNLILSLSVVCVFALVVSSCADRALDAEGGIKATSDLAGVDLRGVDLAQKPVDAGKPVDLAMSAAIGVVCGGVVCKTTEICCGLSGVLGVACTPLGMGDGPNGGGCFGGGGGYRCDGPEDCMNGQRCVGSDVPDPGLSPTQTRCRMNAGNNGVIVCRVNADCRNGSTCMPTTQIESGAPMLSVCE